MEVSGFRLRFPPCSQYKSLNEGNLKFFEKFIVSRYHLFAFHFPEKEYKNGELISSTKSCFAPASKESFGEIKYLNNTAAEPIFLLTSVIPDLYPSPLLC